MKKTTTAIITGEQTNMEAVSTMNPGQTSKRVIRSLDQRIADTDNKIAFHRKAIEALEARKLEIGKPRKPRPLSYAKVFAELKTAGKSPEEIAAFFGGSMEA
jgi:hypothetical protein